MIQFHLKKETTPIVRDLPEVLKRLLRSARDLDSVEITSTASGTFRVRFRNGSGIDHTVKIDPRGFRCSCPDFIHRGQHNNYWCKHVFAVLLKRPVPDSALAIFIFHPELTEYLGYKKVS